MDWTTGAERRICAPLDDAMRRVLEAGVIDGEEHAKFYDDL
jgi:hypothetical protein